MAASRPLNYLEWTADGAANKIAKPPVATQMQGWTAGQPPPYQWVNWLFYTADQWIKWLDQTTYSTTVASSTEPGLRLLNGGNWSFKTDTRVLSWDAPLNLSVPGLTDDANQAAAGSVTLATGQVAYVQANIPISAKGDTAAGSATVSNVDYPAGLVAGMAVRGAGIPNTTVLSVIGTTVTLAAAATTTATQTSLLYSSSGPLTVQAANVQDLVPAPNVVLIARATAAQAVVGVNSGQMALRNGEFKPLLDQGYLSTLSALAGEALPAYVPVYLSRGATDAFVFSCSFASGSTSITTTSTANLQAGMSVSGAGIAAATTIASVTNATTLVLSTATTASGSGASLTFTRIAGRLYRCESGPTTASDRGVYLGLTVEAKLAGTAVLVATDGSVKGLSGLAPGSLYFVDPTVVGGLTATRPVAAGQLVAPVGVALASDTLDLNAAQAATALVVPAGVVGWPNYAVTSSADLTSAIAQAQTAGGVILISAPFTISAAFTVPPGTIVQGRKNAAVITVATGGSLTMSTGSEVRDVVFNCTLTSGNVLTLSGDRCVVRACNFIMTASTSSVAVAVSGNNNALINNFFSGVLAPTVPTPCGISYLSGYDNSDERSTFAT